MAHFTGTIKSKITCFQSFNTEQNLIVSFYGTTCNNATYCSHTICKLFSNA